MKALFARQWKKIKELYWGRKLYKKANCHGEVFCNGSFKLIGNKLDINDNVHFAGDFYIDARGGVKIEENCHISRRFICYSSNHRYEGKSIPYDDQLEFKPVVICKNVWIGMNVSVAPGVHIGEGAVIGLGAVVAKDIPPLAIAVGNPAKVVKYRDENRYMKLSKEGKFGGKNGELMIKSNKK